MGGKALNIYTAFQVIMQQCCKTSFTLFYRSFSLLGSCPRALCAYKTLQSTYTILSRKKQHNMYYVCLSMVCLQFTGDLSFAVGAVSMLMNECNDALIKNITLPASNSTTNSTSNSTQEVIIPAIVEEIGQLLCPNDCASNGKCVNGSCICNKDYTAEDCSISLYQVPDISRLVMCLCETEITQSMNLI